jgi:glycosyltransferase involved in cell wall biosynthesis
MISLIVSTMGRVAEIGALFDSLLSGQGAEFEVILVDQNADRRLDTLVAAYAPRLKLRHVRSAEHGGGLGANAGRNLGLRFATGDVVGFPDDDCVFPPNVLARVRAAFDAEGRLAILTGPAAAPEGGLGSGRWNPQGGGITIANVWTSVIEFNLWIRRHLALALGGFDEAMGPGARFGSAEGNDLVCRAMARGHVARYDFDLRIIHPDKRLTPEAVARARRYGLGLGFALRRHRAPIGTWAPLLYRPLGGIGVSLLRGRMLHARYYAATFQGRLEGFLAPEARSLPEPGRMEPAA